MLLMSFRSKGRVVCGMRRRKQKQIACMVETGRPRCRTCNSLLEKNTGLFPQWLEPRCRQEPRALLAASCTLCPVATTTCAAPSVLSSPRLCNGEGLTVAFFVLVFVFYVVDFFVFLSQTGKKRSREEGTAESAADSDSSSKRRVEDQQPGEEMEAEAAAAQQGGDGVDAAVQKALAKAAIAILKKVCCKTSTVLYVMQTRRRMLYRLLL